MLTVSQVHLLYELIQKQTLIFSAQSLGPELLSDSERKILTDNGLNVDKLYDASKDLVELNFHLGLLSKVLSNSQTQSLTFADLNKYIQSGQYIPLNARERVTVQSIKMQSMADIRSANQRIFNDVNNVVANEFGNARSNQEEYLRDQIATGVGNRESRKKIARRINELTGDWTRDFNKSVQYISHTALNEGRAAMIHRKHDGDNEKAKVYFQVQLTACISCVKSYLTDGVGSKPIIFSLKELEANGSNIGRKQKEWLPTIYPMHPHCYCLLSEYIEGSEWNGSKFLLPEKTKVSHRPKVKITFNGQDYWV